LIQVSGFTFENAALFIGKELAIAILVGIIAGFIWRYVLMEVNMSSNLNYISTVGMGFLLYYATSELGGNSIISIFVFSLLIGNYYKIHKLISPRKQDINRNEFQEMIDSMQCVQNDISFLIAAFFFVLLGITFNPNLLGTISPFLIAGIIATILVVRYFSSQIISLIDRNFSPYKFLITIMVPRGYVAAVLSFVPAQQGIVIPLITDIIVILLIFTTMIAILGAFLFARSQTKKQV
jgi:NhaP-type Na+/H+ or K+/H+ antiporter